MLLSGTCESYTDWNNGGPNSEQFLSSQEALLLNCVVSYGALFKSTRPHCTAPIVNSAMWGPKYRTNVCKPDPESNKRIKKQFIPDQECGKRIVSPYNYKCKINILQAIVFL